MIEVSKELSEAHAKLPINIDSTSVPLDMQMRAIALTLAQRHVGETCVKEGAMYNALKMDNKLGEPVSLDNVIHAALVFERYLWGEWSKGIAENALEATMTEVADAIEKEFDKKRTDNKPTRSSAR
jgi:hypothetical protein